MGRSSRWCHPTICCAALTRNETPPEKARQQSEGNSGCPLSIHKYLRSANLLIYIERDRHKIVIRRPDTFVVGRANFDLHEWSSIGGSLIRDVSCGN
jgi:hypothetical protein